MCSMCDLMDLRVDRKNALLRCVHLEAIHLGASQRIGMHTDLGFVQFHVCLILG